ncbi:MAG: biopolymer transporter ExbD [Gimesia chilikensis]|nr:biopolymer transport protein ExbD [Gimesia chilikensis]
MPIKFYCKHCGQRLSVASKKAGKKVACPACKGRITIPVESEARRMEKTPDPSETPGKKASSSTKKKKPAKAAPPTEAMLDADQNQFLEDLDDMGPLGESWDELLDGDWDAAASAETEEPAIEEEESAPEPAPQPEKQPTKAKSSPPPKPAIEPAPEPEPEPEPSSPVTPAAETEVTAETSPDPETPEDDDLLAASEWLEEIESTEADEDLATEPVSEQSAEPEQDDSAELEEVASTEPGPEPETAPKPVVASAPSPRFVVEEEEDDEDDDDEGFSIRSAESEFEEMDLTPMVDVTFLLLIFFMITASFSLQKSIQVPPPNPDEDGVSQSLQTLDDFREESIIVEIDSNNGIYVDDTKLSNPSEIVQAILDRRDEGGRPKSELVLSAHKAARHETVVAVVDAANEVGMQKIRLASYKGPDD